MGASNTDGPVFVYGQMAALQLAPFGAAVPDYNLDAGPNASFQGDGVLDMRYMFPKDQVQGYVGRVPAHYSMPYLQSIGQIPVAQSASNIASVAGTTSGTALALLTTNVLGVTLNVPIVPYSMGGINNLAAGGSIVNVVALDFGFAFGNCTSGSTTIQVANAFDFEVGMPLVIGGVGNSGGTACLLTNVVSITDTTHIVVASAPLATNATAPIGMGNVSGPSENWSTLANMTPTAALPWMAQGPGLFLDPRQAVARGLRIVGVAGGSGGTFTVKGYDVYNVPMTETITVGAGAVTGWGVKAWKYIASITPNFTDAHAYTVGTSDVFGFHYRAPLWDNIDVTWNGTYVNTSAGFTAGLSLITAATATTADVRGTIQVSANGGGTPIAGATASTGTVSSLAMSGLRLQMSQTIPVQQMLYANPASATIANTVGNFTAAPLFGNAQF